MKTNDLINYARGGKLNISKIRIMAIKNGKPVILKQKPNSENLTICVCENIEQKALFPPDGTTIFTTSLEGAITLYNL
ncbi:MAG: hypothetical protein EOM06_15235 [Sphingobacteriia bacterium]|nr:hypothetical protein [Sphingobacteriia bacterium]